MNFASDIARAIVSPIESVINGTPPPVVSTGIPYSYYVNDYINTEVVTPTSNEMSKIGDEINNIYESSKQYLYLIFLLGIYIVIKPSK